MSDQTNMIRGRLEVVADAMRLKQDAPPVISASDIETALASDENLVAFAQRHAVNVDYLRTGDVRSMIRAFKELQRRERAVQQVSTKLAARRTGASASAAPALPKLP
jgi:hypothetical protein